MKVREPREELLWLDRRCFVSEDELLLALADRKIPRVPPLAETDLGFVIHGFIEGRTLGDGRPAGHTVPIGHIDQIMELFSHLAAVKPYDLDHVERRCLYKGRPKDEDRAENTENAENAENEDTGAFLKALVRFTESQAYRAQLPVFGTLFDALGIPDGALDKLASAAGGLARRPFCLLHGDLHRENFIVDVDQRLWTIDWELAMIGDPVYDLATHLYLMRYPQAQEAIVIERWRETVESVRPGASQGVDRDLDQYLAYKRAQSVYTDVIRTAVSLRGRPDGGGWLHDHAARRVREVLARAREPLGLPPTPGTARIARAYDDWRHTAATPPADAAPADTCPTAPLPIIELRPIRT
ncbi:phosphotransferase [Streptomyces sp. H27-D2]|uniref:phosphotransferase n=1 Tax=Streptomyces sp. H27-D2 TaxID=3046304 RepID=UPI002DBC853A|nr:phosphotransferase [Streptomyces sp. H27-D2]MEC4015687.1 phosphotransferase [Streptomyces sp. H27-D2]